MLEWQFNLALMLHEPYATTRELLRNALHALADVYQPRGAYAAIIEQNGGLVGLCSLGDADEARIKHTLIAPVLDDNCAVLSVESYSAAVPLQARGHTFGVIALTQMRDTAFDDDMLFDLEAGVSLIAAAAATMLQREAADEARLQQAQLQHDLTAMTYHDLRAPLQNVQTSFAALERLMAKVEDGRVRDVIQTGAQSTRQIGRIIRSLLDMERLENGSIQLHPQPTPLAEVMDDVLGIVAPLAQEANHQLIVTIEPSLPALMVDGNLIERVLINLIENAIKYTPSGGSIRITAGTSGGAACIKVADDGPGIPYHLREAIFDKFYRIRATSGRDGIGLGLSFCRLAIEAHGGNIRVEGDDTGAQFVFTLPVDASQAAQAS